MDCLCCFRLAYVSLGCDEEGEDLEGAEVGGGICDGERGLRSSCRGCISESFGLSGQGEGELTGIELSEAESVLATSSGEASSGFAMRRPPSEPDKSRSPFMMELRHSIEIGGLNRQIDMCVYMCVCSMFLLRGRPGSI